KPVDSTEALEAQIPLLKELAQKRARLQKTLGENPEPSTSGSSPDLSAIDRISAGDREGHQLTLRLLEDRKKELERELEKLRGRETEAKGELRLQRKMRDFLDGIQRMNESSDFPHTSLERSDLGDAGDRSQDERLQSRLTGVQGDIAAGEMELKKTRELILKISSQLDKKNL